MSLFFFFCGQNEAEKYKHELENILFFVYSNGWITIYEHARAWVDLRPIVLEAGCKFFRFEPLPSIQIMINSLILMNISVSSSSE